MSHRPPETRRQMDATFQRSSSCKNCRSRGRKHRLNDFLSPRSQWRYKRVRRMDIAEDFSGDFLNANCRKSLHHKRRGGGCLHLPSHRWLPRLRSQVPTVSRHSALVSDSWLRNLKDTMGRPAAAAWAEGKVVHWLTEMWAFIIGSFCRATLRGK